LKPAQANSAQDSISKKPIKKKRTGGVNQGVDPEFKSRYHKKKKNAMPQWGVVSHACNARTQEAEAGRS
jgi:hypothetical protein